MSSETSSYRQEISPVEKPVQFERPQFGASLIQVGSLIRAPQARNNFSVTGKGLTVAVLDTGLRTTHLDFEGRVIEQQNFTADNGGNVDDASDGNGHGTNVAGIIVANRFHTGIAPGANVIPIKVLSNRGGGSFSAIRDALQWVIESKSTSHYCCLYVFR
ncbi:MAG: S8 family serine peptidase [Symploca sp. SIO2D2]|nr:S8 family serine peptidase [Symploca sp. SIO2D2]